MPPSSLIRVSHQRQQSRNGEELHWGRAGVDGMPYRGPAPQFTEAEYEARTVRVAEACNGFFDMEVEAERREFLSVLDCFYNHWTQILHIERFWRGTSKHYVEWLEYFREDGTRAPMVPPHGSGGQVNGARDVLRGA